MDTDQHTLAALFEQLGLDNSDDFIDEFVKSHKPIPGPVPIHAAEFWTDAQAAFLQEAVAEDADWAEVVDHLDAMLRN